MGKKKNKKVKRKFRIFIVILVFLLIISFAIVMVGAYVFNVKTSSVLVYGNNIVSEQEILESAGLEERPNFFLANTTVIESNLEKNPYIKDVDIKRNLYLQINIYVEEYEPLFIREDINMVVFDKKNEVLNDGTKNLSIPSLVNYVPDTKYEVLIDKMKVLDYSLVKKISQIMYSPTKYDEDRFIFYMNDSNRVYINLPKFKSFNKYDEMVTKFEGKTGKLYLDSGNYFEIDK